MAGYAVELHNVVKRFHGPTGEEVTAVNIQKLDKSKLTIPGNFAPQYMGLAFDPNNDYSVPYESGTDAIVVNTAKVTDVPKSWADLWKPEYAGKMVFLDDSRAVIGLTLLALSYDVNTKDPEQLDEAKTKLAQLVPGIKLFDSDSPKTALIAGDADLGETWTFEALAAEQQVPAIQYINRRRAPFCGRTITPSLPGRRTSTPRTPGSTTACSPTCSG
jgi:spermidine/putrescine-binding protein